MALFQWGSRVSTRMGSTVWSRMGPVSRLEWTLPPSHRIVLWLTICWTCLQLLPTARLVPLKYHTMQTAPSYAGTMNSPVTRQSHTENAARFTNWWRTHIWAGLLRPKPYVHWVQAEVHINTYPPTVTHTHAHICTHSHHTDTHSLVYIHTHNCTHSHNYFHAQTHPHTHTHTHIHTRSQKGDSCEWR